MLQFAGVTFWPAAWPHKILVQTSTAKVELNTIASGFGWLGPASAKIHRLVYTVSSLLDNMSLHGNIFYVFNVFPKIQLFLKFQ